MGDFFLLFSLFLLIDAFNLLTFKVIIDTCFSWHFIDCFAFVFVGL